MARCVSVLVGCLLCAWTSQAQEGKRAPGPAGASAGQRTAAEREYADGHGGTVRFPLGDRSFADEVVSFTSGTPAAANARDRDPKQILGAPNYDQAADTNYLTLGCGGTVIVRFTDNALVDTPGPDLYVFEVGPQVEPTGVAISEDGNAWIEIGKVEGGQASVDIHPFVRPGRGVAIASAIAGVRALGCRPAGRMALIRPSSRPALVLDVEDERRRERDGIHQVPAVRGHLCVTTPGPFRSASTIVSPGMERLLSSLLSMSALLPNDR
jgi:hypothetical protein